MGLDIKGANLDFTRLPTPIIRKASLFLVSSSHSLRCDAKQAEERFIEFGKLIRSVEHFELGDYIPTPFVKGSQPKYIESPDEKGIPVINTLSIQNLAINFSDCRHISEQDFERLSYEKKLRKNDVLLTVDGGTSIGKAVLFDIDDDFTVDSHVAILRPSGIDPSVIVYLLASPLGQLQFQQAESGASGQTAVIENDVRTFRFPMIQRDQLAQLIDRLDETRKRIAKERQELEDAEKKIWKEFGLSMFESAKSI